MVVNKRATMGQDTKNGQVLISGREYLMEVVAENSRDISEFLILLPKPLLSPVAYYPHPFLLGYKTHPISVVRCSH
jgi:hypothetical protein